MITDPQSFFERFLDIVGDTPITKFEPRTDAYAALDQAKREISPLVVITSAEWQEVFARCNRHAHAHMTFPAAPSERVFLDDNSPRAKYIRSIATTPPISVVGSDGRRYHNFGTDKVFHSAEPSPRRRR